MKKTVSLLLSMIFLFSACSAFAQYRVPDNPRQVPASVRKTPFMPNMYTTQYAPWLHNLNLLSPNELANGIPGGEACQQIESIAISPVDGNIMYFGTDTSGVWKSHTGGEHWYNVVNNTHTWHVQGIVCDVFDKEIVYISLGKDGVYRTRNGGNTWEQILLDECRLVKGQYYADKIAQDKLGNTYMSVSSGIYKLDRKTDALTNLTPEYASFVKDQEFKVYDLWVSDDGQKIYAAALHSTDVPGGIYISHDYGKTWKHTNLFANEPGMGTAATSIAAHPENPDHIFVTAGSYNIESPKVSVTTPKGSPDTPAELYESTDGGETWTKLYTLYYENGEEGVKKTAKSMYRLFFGPMQNGVYPLYASGKDIQYTSRVSYDYGRTFAAMHGRTGIGTFRENVDGSGETGWLSQALVPDPHNPGVVWFCGGGPNRWENFNVQRKSSGFSGLSVTYLAMSDEGDMFLTATDVGTVRGIGKYTKDSFPTFKKGARGVITMFAIDPKDSNHIVAFDGNSNTSKNELGIKESFDGGISYGDIKPETIVESNTFILEYDAHDSNTIYASDYTSHDNGKTWTKNEYYILAVSKLNPNKMLGRKIEDKAHKLYYTDDGGKNWRYLREGRSNYVELQFDLSDDNYIWYTAYNKMGKIDISTGEEIAYENKFTYKFFRHFAQNPKDPNHIVLCLQARPDASNRETNEQVMESTDGGETWHVVPGFWPVYMQRVFFSKTTDEVFLTGHAGTFIYNYKVYEEFLSSKISVLLDDKEVSFSVMPEITNGRTMVPMRELFEMLGATVEWDGETRTVSAKKGHDEVKLQIGSDNATVNGAQTILDASPYIKDGRTLIPLRFASEALGIRVGWDNATRKIIMFG